MSYVERRDQIDMRMDHDPAFKDLVMEHQKPMYRTQAKLKGVAYGFLLAGIWHHNPPQPPAPEPGYFQDNAPTIPNSDIFKSAAILYAASFAVGAAREKRLLNFVVRNNEKDPMLPVLLMPKDGRTPTQFRVYQFPKANQPTYTEHWGSPELMSHWDSVQGMLAQDQPLSSEAA